MNDIVVIDTETTGLNPDLHPVWEIAGLRCRLDEDRGTLAIVDYLDIQVELTDFERQNHDPYAQKLTKFDERYDEAMAVTKAGAAMLVLDLFGSSTSALAPMRERPHIVGAVPSFDALRLGMLIGANSFHMDRLVEPWHYHYVCVENLVAGCSQTLPPWNSDDLTKMTSVTPQPEELRHTAMSDTLWALDLYAWVYDLIVDNSEVVAS